MRFSRLRRGDGGAGLGPAGAGRRREEKPPLPRWRWALWWALLAPALVLFYVIFLPAWLGIRIARLFAGMRSRQVKRSQSSTGGFDGSGG